MSNPIDEYVRRSLADQEIAPSRNLFADKIQPRIEQRKAAAFPFLRVAAAIVLLLAGWMIIQLINRPINGNERLQEAPIAVEQPMELPTTEIKKEEPAVMEATTPIKEEVQQQRVAVQTQSAAKSKKHKKDINVAALQPEPVQFAEAETAANPVKATEEKQEIKVRLKIDPTKYANAAMANTELEETTPTVGEYASEQFNNLKERQGLQAPPKEWFELPKLAVKVEGNPLKSILNGKE